MLVGVLSIPVLSIPAPCYAEGCVAHHPWDTNIPNNFQENIFSISMKIEWKIVAVSCAFLLALSTEAFVACE